MKPEHRSALVANRLRILAGLDPLDLTALVRSGELTGLLRDYATDLSAGPSSDRPSTSDAVPSGPGISDGRPR